MSYNLAESMLNIFTICEPHVNAFQPLVNDHGLVIIVADLRISSMRRMQEHLDWKFLDGLEGLTGLLSPIIYI